MRAILLACVFQFSIKGNTQLLSASNDAYLRMGAYSNSQADVFSFTANQAALTQLKNFAVGSFGERRFLLKDIAYWRAVFSMPAMSGNFGAEADYFGSVRYNEMRIGFAYAKRLGNDLSIGTQFNYIQVRAGGYGNNAAISFELGTIFRLTERLNGGIHLDNPIGGKFRNASSGKLPSVYTIGFGYDISDMVFLSTEISKEETQPVNVNAGLLYNIVSRLQVRAGISTATSSPWFGVGWRAKEWKASLMFSYHPSLGMTPGFAVLFNFKDQTP